MEPVIALAGNPNAGKTTLFNRLTGARQHVGNYPGVTVEKKEGICGDNGNRFHVVDLPGTYSLTAYSLEEVVARDFLVNEKPRLVVNIVDASNLERNLYLTLQFMEMGIPVCIALNMMDVARSRGMEIDAARLSRLMGVPVVPMVARSGKGKKALLDTIRESIDQLSVPSIPVSYGYDVDTALGEIVKIVASTALLTDIYPARWTALKYLENDDEVIQRGREANKEVSADIERIVSRVADHVNRTLDTFPEAIIADHRYGFIKSILKQGVITLHQDQNRQMVSDRIDKVVTHRFLGPLVMAAILIGLYKFTFTYSEAPVGWLEAGFGYLGGLAESYLPEGLMKSLIISGIIDGVGGVLGFAPLIMFMFFGIAILEDSGYLARVAYMLDRVFRIFGLHGSSVMAFIVSGGIAGGCAVPGVMAARTLKSPRERLATLLTVPFMNCGAKLPVFALLVAAFFAENETAVMMGVTILAWIGALFVAKLLRTTVIRGEATPFVMELPPYRFPTFRGLFIHTWERTWQYIQKAGTVILGISVLLWAMMTFPHLPEDQSRMFDLEKDAITASVQTMDDEGREPLKTKLAEIAARESEARLHHSFAGRLGTWFEGVTRLAGFDWKTNIALIGGFAAKEVVVSTLGTAYSLGDVDPDASGSLAERLSNSPGWRPLSALSLIVFIMFYSPCFVAVVCIAREAGSWKWGAFSVVFNTLLAFALAVTVFQVGSFLGY